MPFKMTFSCGLCNVSDINPSMPFEYISTLSMFNHADFPCQTDAHFGNLSVYTTLKFAVESRTPLNVVSRRELVDRSVSSVAELFGLSGVLANQIDRISGGQKRRVSLAEAFVTHPR